MYWCSVGALAERRGRHYDIGLPGKFCLDRWKGHSPEWNFARTGWYHRGTSKVGTARKKLIERVFGLDDAVRNKYDSRLSRNGDGSSEIELFDNREWNQNVRGELVVARRSTGAGEPSSRPVYFNDSDTLSTRQRETAVRFIELN